MNTIESLQRWLAAKGFNPGPFDGIDGPRTFAAWSAYLLSTNASNPGSGNPTSKEALSKLLAKARANLGVLSTSGDPGTGEHGSLGCADAVTRILHDQLGYPIKKTDSTNELYDELVSARWQAVDLTTPGSVIVSPRCRVMYGHTGIVGEDGVIYSNSSATGLWEQNWKISSWKIYYAPCGCYAFAPPGEAAVGDPIGFARLGSSAPIRGQFSITNEKIRSLCTGDRERFTFYADAIVEDAAKYKLNPLFILADFFHQNVNSSYFNPWGISADNYPYGPGGTQLGQPNGSIVDGPRKFSPDEWRTAFDRQFWVVASSSRYANANTIAEWAVIDAPIMARNDPFNTNPQEGVEVGAIYDQLVAKLA
jgi:hypothetical protein